MGMLLCPCGSGKELFACCAPIVAGTPAATAEALMRSRYTAYVEGKEDYLLQSWHPETRPAGLQLDDTEWLGLKVIRCQQGQAGDDEGIVEFTASFRVGDRVKRLHEISQFRRLDGRWYYHSGRTRLEDVGRNEPCPCGSGKKFKRCCG